MSSELPTSSGFARTDDDVELFWRSVGQGPVTLVCCNGIGVGVFFWDYLVERFAERYRVVVWDYRGHGRSSPWREGQRVDIPRLALDLGAVCEAAGVERAVFLGHSMGSQVILERGRQAPEQFLGLISVLGTFGHPLDTFADLAGSRQLFDVLIALAKGFPHGFDRLASLLAAAPWAFDAGKLLKLVDGKRISRHDLRMYLHHLAGGMTFRFFFTMAEAMGEHSARDILKTLDVPALVIAGEFDAFTPPALAQELAEGLPDARLVMMQGASHAGLVEQPEVMNEAIARFLRERILDE